MKFVVGDIIYCKKDKLVFDYKGDGINLNFGDKYIVMYFKEGHIHIWGGTFLSEDKIIKIMYKPKRLSNDFGYISELRKLKLEKINDKVDKIEK